MKFKNIKISYKPRNKFGKSKIISKFKIKAFGKAADLF